MSKLSCLLPRALVILLGAFHGERRNDRVFIQTQDMVSIDLA